jgi:hypothetical protein
MNPVAGGLSGYASLTTCPSALPVHWGLLF